MRVKNWAELYRCLAAAAGSDTAKLSAGMTWLTDSVLEILKAQGFRWGDDLRKFETYWDLLLMDGPEKEELES